VAELTVEDPSEHVDLVVTDLRVWLEEVVRLKSDAALLDGHRLGNVIEVGSVRICRKQERTTVATSP
jgi:hypothetical protein